MLQFNKLLESFRENLMHLKINTVTLWGELKLAKSNTIVRSMHIWLLLVPIAARIMAKFENPLYIPIAEKVYIFDISLPFTWSIFFFSALFFTMGNIIFIIFSPKIIKENNNYRDFEQAGKNEGHLEAYFNKETLRNWRNHKRELIKNPYSDKTNLQDWFWSGYKEQNTSSVMARLSCAISYLVGFSLFLFVALENISWVIRVSIF